MYKIYGTDGCTYCVKAKELAEKKGITFQYIDIQKDENSVEMLKSRGFKTIPQIFNGDDYIGGYAQFEKVVNEK